MSEDYKRAKTLRTIEFMGESFRVVRRRINGKPWHKYLTLLHDNVPMVTSIPRTTDPAEAAEYWLKCLERGFETREALLAGIAAQRERVAA